MLWFELDDADIVFLDRDLDSDPSLDDLGEEKRFLDDAEEDDMVVGGII